MIKIIIPVGVKNYFNQAYFIYFLIIFTIIFGACKKEIDPKTDLLITNQKPYFISNEGAYGFGNSSLSLYYPDSNIIANQVFEPVNGRKPGDVMQSVFAFENHLFLVINSSNKMEVANATTLKEIATISNLPLPRFMAASSAQKGYISCWGENGVIKVIDLTNLSISKTITVGNGPEKMLLVNDLLLVCNSGGYKNDSTLSLINLSNDQLIKHLKVGDNPVDLVKYDDSISWILCRGLVEYGGGGQITAETSASLVQVNFLKSEVLKVFSLASTYHPTHLEISSDKKYLFYGGGYGSQGVYRFDIASQQLPTVPFINETFYGINVHPKTGEIFGLEAQNFTMAGRLKIYSPEGLLKSTHKTGIGPNQIFFQ